MQRLTISSEVEVEGGRDGNVDHAQESLILLLELLLIKDLDRDDTAVLDHDIESFVPVRIQTRLGGGMMS